MRDQRSDKGPFKVVDISGREDGDLRTPEDMALLDLRIDACKDCSDNSITYKTRQEALDHIGKHCRAGSNASHFSDHWVMNVESYGNYLHRKEALKIIDDISECFSEIERSIPVIKYGVSYNGKLDSETYRISSCMVDAFEQLTMKVILGADMVNATYCNRIGQDGVTKPPVSLRPSLLEASKYFGCQAKQSMIEAENQIESMSCTSGLPDIETYVAVGPELVLSLLMKHFRYRDGGSDSVNLVDLYQSYMLKLVRHPFCFISSL